MKCNICGEEFFGKVYIYNHRDCCIVCYKKISGRPLSGAFWMLLPWVIITTLLIFFIVFDILDDALVIVLLVLESIIIGIIAFILQKKHKKEYDLFKLKNFVID